jgi:hypothetical protein
MYFVDNERVPLLAARYKEAKWSIKTVNKIRKSFETSLRVDGSGFTTRRASIGKHSILGVASSKSKGPSKQKSREKPNDQAAG